MSSAESSRFYEDHTAASPESLADVYMAALDQQPGQRLREQLIGLGLVDPALKYTGEYENFDGTKYITMYSRPVVAAESGFRAGHNIRRIVFNEFSKVNDHLRLAMDYFVDSTTHEVAMVSSRVDLSNPTDPLLGPYIVKWSNVWQLKQGGEYYAGLTQFMALSFSPENERRFLVETEPYLGRTTTVVEYLAA